MIDEETEQTEQAATTFSAAKLREARAHFEAAVDHDRAAHAEAHRAARFYHNTRNEGQWESADLQYLRDNMRPAYTFNIVKDKIDSALGIYADAQRAPSVVGAGAEDHLAAEVLDIVVQQILQDANYESKSGAQLKTGTIQGECDLGVSVQPSPDGPGWIEIGIDRYMPFEVHWDSSSIEADRSDARHVFADRWFRKDEFENAYPEHAAEWGRLSMAGDPLGGDSDRSFGESGMSGGRNPDWGADSRSHYYYDRHANKARVIRYEYKTWVEEEYATNLQTGERRKIESPEERDQIDFAVALGAPFTLDSVKVERVKACDFVGTTILREYDEVGPFDGFSIDPYCYLIDEEDGTAYGAVRNLFDPQMELNKSKSMEIEHIAQSIAVGVISEAGAVQDEDEFAAELRKPGGNAIVRKGQMGAVQLRQPSPPNAAVMQRAQTAVELLDRISSMPSSGNVVPAEFQSSAAASYLRYHKARQVVRDPIANYEASQDRVVRRVVEAVVRAMPDDQIEAILASEGRYLVRNGIIVELTDAPDGSGRKVPKSRTTFRDVRSMRWNLELEYTTENSTLRMMELEVLISLKQAGVPIDDEVLVEAAASSRATRERLKKYAEQAKQAAAKAQAQEAEAFAVSTRGSLQLQAAEAAETARHNRVTEKLQSEKQEGDLSARFADIWQTADQNEKELIVQFARDRLKARQQSARGV